MSQNDIDAAFDDIEDAFDQLEEEEQPAEGDDIDAPMHSTAAADEGELAEEEDDDNPPGLESEADAVPAAPAEAEAGAAAAEPETVAAETEAPAPEAPVSKEDAKPARKRPAFKKPAAKKTAPDEGASKAVEKSKASTSGADEVPAEDDSENKPSNKQATESAPATDVSPDTEASEEKKPGKAPVKSKKIPVPRKLKPTAPPDPCNYTAPKEDKKENEEKPAKKASKAAGKNSKADGPKLPSAKSAYFIFSAEQRGPLKNENADLSFGEINKQLGEMWSGLSEEEKTPYVEQAEEDKERVEKLIQADPALLALRDENKSSGKKGSKAAKANKSLAVAASKVMKPVKKAVKKPSKKKSPAGADDESADADGAAADSDDAEKREGSEDAGKGRASKGRASKRKANRAIRNEEVEDSDEEYDWEADHEDCDWAAHPAECIIAVTNKQKYVVKRKGLPFHEYGLVPVNAAKRHCSGQDAGTSEPPKVTAEMINEFEAYKKDFSNQTVDHTFSRELDLEDLEKDSKLECCAFMGDLRREGVLTKAHKKYWDFDECSVMFSVMTLSFVVQRMLFSATEPLRQKIAQLEKAAGAPDQGMEMEA